MVTPLDIIYPVFCLCYSCFIGSAGAKTLRHFLNRDFFSGCFSNGINQTIFLQKLNGGGDNFILGMVATKKL